MSIMKYEDIRVFAREQRMKEAVCVAADLFLTHGIEAVKMTDIATASGVGVASLYRYFGTKETLVAQVGELLWNDLRVLFDGVFSGRDFDRASGIDRIAAMLGAYRTLFADHGDFVLFVAQFDLFVVNQKVDRRELARYEKSVLNYYPLFKQAYDRGVADGSVRAGVDPEAYYRAVSHAVMALMQKLLRGKVLDSDDYNGAQELDLLLDAALCYLKR